MCVPGNWGVSSQSGRTRGSRGSLQTESTKPEGHAGFRKHAFAYICNGKKSQLNISLRTQTAYSGQILFSVRE